jgi:hypothetical protein
MDMVVGDIVSGIFTTTSVAHYFQPAASVEVMVTWCGGRGAQTYTGLSNGVTDSMSAIADNAEFNSGSNTRLAINNTNYYVGYAVTSPPSYAGIQIK